MLQTNNKDGPALVSGGDYTSHTCPYAYSSIQIIASVKKVSPEFFKFFYFSSALKVTPWPQRYLKSSKAHFSLSFSTQSSNLPSVVSSAACNVSLTHYSKAPVKLTSSSAYSLHRLNGNFQSGAYAPKTFKARQEKAGFSRDSVLPPDPRHSLSTYTDSLNAQRNLCGEVFQLALLFLSLPLRFFSLLQL